MSFILDFLSVWIRRTNQQGVFSSQKFSPKTSHQILRCMHRVLNVDEIKKLIAQFTVKSRDESFKPN
jgi:hypothetical protein